MNKDPTAFRNEPIRIQNHEYKEFDVSTLTRDMNQHIHALVAPHEDHFGSAAEDVRCDDEYIMDPNAAPFDRWGAAGAEWALESAIYNWTKDQASSEPSDLSFSEHVANYFGAKEFFICHDVGDGPCKNTISCEEVNQPAGSLIPTAEAIENDLSLAMGSFFQAWLDTEIEFLHSIFSGESDGIGVLRGLVNSGLCLELTRDLDLGSFVKEAQKLMYAKMIPIAWERSSKEIEFIPRRMIPMILMIPDDCVTSGGVITWRVNKEKSEKIAVCHDGHTFFIGYPDWLMDLFEIEPGEHLPQLQALPGGEHDVLDGKNWGGLTLEDMVVSVYEGFRLNGYKNGYLMPEDSHLIDGNGAAGGVHFEHGVRTPGFTSLPLCTLGKLTNVTSEWVTRRQNFEKPGFDDFPCGDGSLTIIEMIEFGFSVV
ncbi:hypothetical protein G7Z17_g2051 [Cylindrodendrum hubeiense]|uniref:Uncharacterized protein n=1 Tax=Cylindrodendrum hubeiense TaxID=595255 RepID=A0A9P5LKS0_9HYPO|nr:hypothetical protein G7Z17_g2051 [Cylindrodendrum hubeiense]